MTKSPKYRAFTLLEIMVALVIMSMVASVVGWQITRCISRYTFQSEVEELYNRVKNAQVLALTFKTDITLSFFQEKGLLYYQLKTDEPFSAAQFDQKPKPLKQVKLLTFNSKATKNLLLSLYSQGTLDPPGVLGFFPDKHKKQGALWIDFQGAFFLSLRTDQPRTIKEISIKKPTKPKK